MIFKFFWYWIYTLSANGFSNTFYFIKRLDFLKINFLSCTEFDELDIKFAFYWVWSPSNKSVKRESVDFIISLINEFFLLASFKKNGIWYFRVDLHEFKQFMLWGLFLTWLFYYFISKSNLESCFLFVAVV